MENKKIQEFALWGIFGLELIKSLYQALNLHFPVIGPICIMIDDAKLFLTILSLVILVYIAKETTEHKTKNIILCLFDLSMIHKLYSDKIWAYHKTKIILMFMTLKLQVVVFGTLFIVFVILISFRLIKSNRKREDKTEKYGPDVIEVNPQNSKSESARRVSFKQEGSIDAETKFDKKEDIFCENNSAPVNQENDNVYNHEKSETKWEVAKPDDLSSENQTRKTIDNKEKGEKAFTAIFYVSILIVLIAVIEWLVIPRWEKEGGRLPAWWDMVEKGLVILFIIGVAYELLFIMVIIFRAIKKKNQLWDCGLNLIAIGISVFLLAVILSKHKLGSNLLDKFLSAVTNNSIVALIIVPFAVFMMMRIFLIMLLNLFFPEAFEDKWTVRTKEKLKKVEEGLILFVCNLYAGIVSLFLFIPDFLNEISGVLLDEDNLFPHDKINFNEEYSEKNDGEEKHEQPEKQKHSS